MQLQVLEHLKPFLEEAVDKFSFLLVPPLEIGWRPGGGQTQERGAQK